MNFRSTSTSGSESKGEDSWSKSASAEKLLWLLESLLELSIQASP